MSFLLRKLFLGHKNVEPLGPNFKPFEDLGAIAKDWKEYED